MSPIQQIAKDYELNESYVDKRFARMKYDYERLFNKVTKKEQQRAVDGAISSAEFLAKKIKSLPLHWLPETDIVYKMQDDLSEFITVLKMSQPKTKTITSGWNKRALSGWLHTFHASIEKDCDYADFLSLALPYFDITDDPESFERIPLLD